MLKAIGSFAGRKALMTELREVSIRELRVDEEQHWEAFAVGAAQGSFFHRLPWRQIIERCLGQKSYYRSAWRGDQLVGILPLTEIRSRIFGHSLISPGFGVSAGIVADEIHVAQLLAADAAQLGQSLGVDYVELRHEVPRPIDWATPAPHFFVFRRELTLSEEQNLKAIPRKKRADLRKALANTTLRLEHGQDFDSFFRLYALSMRNLGTPILQKDFYASIAREFGPDVEISVVYGLRGPIAAVMSYYWRGTVLPYYGGSSPEARELHAYDLLYWGVMCRAIERGSRVFDFGRSRIGGTAFDYKTYWGFSPIPMHYQYHLGKRPDVPHVGPDNPRYQSFIKIWKRLPLSVSTAIGPLIARQIG